MTNNTSSKSIDNNNNNNNLLSDIILKHINTNKLSIISEPSFANDIIKKCQFGLTVATKAKR